MKFKRSLWKVRLRKAKSGVPAIRWILRTAQAMTGGLSSLKLNSQPGIYEDATANEADNYDSGVQCGAIALSLSLHISLPLPPIPLPPTLSSSPLPNVSSKSVFVEYTIKDDTKFF